MEILSYVHEQDGWWMERIFLVEMIIIIIIFHLKNDFKATLQKEGV